MKELLTIKVVTENNDNDYANSEGAGISTMEAILQEDIELMFGKGIKRFIRKIDMLRVLGYQIEIE
jgi:hypothetical protein